MSLKKSDKIIAVVGVIILICAGIGILLYATEEDENGGKPPVTEKTKTFDITYQESPPMAAIPDNTAYSIKPKLLNSRMRPYVGNVIITQKNLKSVTFFVRYNDNIKGFLGGRLFPTIGADTLTVSIKDSEGNAIVTKSNKGSLRVNETLEVGSLISLEPIEAEDKLEAYDILEERYVDYEETYKITISLKTGFWGKIREILKTDTFKLEVTYTYYEYDLEGFGDYPPNEPDDGMPPLGSNVGTGIYAATNFGLTKL